jgi:hypothetical protein
MEHTFTFVGETSYQNHIKYLFKSILITLNKLLLYIHHVDYAFCVACLKVYLYNIISFLQIIKFIPLKGVI